MEPSKKIARAGFNRWLFIDKCMVCETAVEFETDDAGIQTAHGNGVADSDRCSRILLEVTAQASRAVRETRQTVEVFG